MCATTHHSVSDKNLENWCATSSKNVILTLLQLPPQVFVFSLELNVLFVFNGEVSHPSSIN